MASGVGQIMNWLKNMWDRTYNYLRVAITGGVGYENPPDAWMCVKKGQRWTKVLTYATALGTSSSYTSSSITAQDGAGNNYTEIRVFLYQTGSTNTTVKVQQSDDNSTWYDIPNQSINLTADGAGADVFNVHLDYIRIVESNDDSSNAQTANKVVVELL